MEAFATYTDLELRLNRRFDSLAEQEWITALLEDASTYLRDDVLGQQVYPASESTFTAYPDGGRVDLPQSPVLGVAGVVRIRDDKELEFDRRDNTLFVGTDEPVAVSFAYGYATPPASLVRWTCVLVSQALLPLESELGLTAGGLSSVQIDDFKAAWADAGADSGISLTDRNIALLRNQFGSQLGYVVGTR